MISVPAQVRNARVLPENDAAFRRALAQYEGKRIVLVVKLYRKNRSQNQNDYYWPVIVRTICDKFGYGPEDELQVHEALKAKFLPKRYENGLEIPPRYSKLNTAEAEEYHEHIRRWMLVEHNCKIPLPNEIEIEEFELN